MSRKPLFWLDKLIKRNGDVTTLGKIISDVDENKVEIMIIPSLEAFDSRNGFYVIPDINTDNSIVLSVITATNHETRISYADTDWRFRDFYFSSAEPTKTTLTNVKVIYKKI